MQWTESTACQANQRFNAYSFLVFGLFFAGAAIHEIVTLPGGALPDPSPLVATLWMVPILVLSATFFLTFSMLNRSASGRTLVMANATAIRWIAIGLIVSAGWESVARMVFERVMPEMLAVGGKDHLFLTALIFVGVMLMFLSRAMSTAARLKEEHDHIL